MDAQDDPSIRWRLRRDLEIHRADLHADSGWTIKDPLRLTYFHVNAEEMAFLSSLDGRLSMNRALWQLQESFPGSEFSVFNLHQFLLSSIRGGLLQSCVPGHGSLLAQAWHRQAGWNPLHLFSRLSFRIRGIDPAGILGLLDRAVGWIYTRFWMILASCFVVVVAFLVLSRHPVLFQELPGLASLFTVDNVPVLFVAIVSVKILHEFGHALTCHHFGGECHELGLLVVGFLPLLYCDVSDSWLQQDRRKRMLVSAAGIIVELIVASIAGVLWMTSHPGTLHTFFLNVMLVCSFNTLIVNGNPLLRYDGYYVLSDWLNIPNLFAEARMAAGALLDRVILGLPSAVGRPWSVSGQIAMTLFGFLSFFYRILMAGALLWFIHGVLRPWGFESIAVLMAVSTGGAFLMASVRTLRSRWNSLEGDASAQRRALAGILVTTMVAGILLMTPFPHHVNAPFVVTPGVCRPVFAGASGFIVPHVQPGSNVEAGTVIAALTNPEIALSIATVEGELRTAEKRLAALASLQYGGQQSASLLPTAAKTVEMHRKRLETLRSQNEGLTVLSPSAGTVFPDRNVASPKGSKRLETSWFGYALDARNQSAWIAEQTLLCWVGAEQDHRAVCLVSEYDIEFVKPGTPVKLTLNSWPGEPVDGRVDRIDVVPKLAVEREFVVNQMIAVKNAETLAPVTPFFGVYVQPLSGSSHQNLPLYTTGYARVECAPMSLARRAWRTIRRTFSSGL